MSARGAGAIEKPGRAARASRECLPSTRLRSQCDAWA
jgi:hypothetical protein